MLNFMLKNNKQISSLEKMCSRLSGTIKWHHKPSDILKDTCNGLLETLSGDPYKFLSESTIGTVRKHSYRKLIVMQVKESMQIYFKIYLPDISLKWGRGFFFFKPPALREADSIGLLHRLGIGAVKIVGAATLPWKKVSFIQPVSVLITTSESHIRKLSHPATYSLTASQKRLLAGKIIKYAGILHNNGFGNLDMHPNNILVDRKKVGLLLCDMERLSPLRPWNKYKRITQDYRKIHKTISLLLQDVKIIGFRQNKIKLKGLNRHYT